MNTFTANKRIGCIALALGVSLAALAATPAMADDWGYRHHQRYRDSGSFSFGLNTPGYYYDQPGYYYNPPAYYYPPPEPQYYYPPPTYYAPPPAYYYGPEFNFGLSLGTHR